jgi:hypothetical protein
MQKMIHFIYIFLLFSVLLNSQPKNPTNSAYEGTHFMIGFMQNDIKLGIYGVDLEVFITSKDSTIVRVKDFYNFDQTYFIKPDSILLVYVPDYNMTTDSESPIANGIEITSDFPVSVWGYNSMSLTTDGFAAIPIKDWGTEYVALSLPNDQYFVPDNVPEQDSIELASPRSSEFMIVAATDGTTIEFQPKSITIKGKQINNKYYATLNKGDCYLVKSYLAQRGYGDLSGTIVKGNKPFGFFSGHVRTANPQNINLYRDSKNHLVEMLLPTNSWGREYVSVPFNINKSGDLIRITNIQPKTNVYCQTKGSIKSYYLETEGSVITIPNFNLPARWSSDKPIQIGQYIMHDIYSNSDDEQFYDPSFVVIPATNSFTNKAVFYNPKNPIYNRYQFVGHGMSLIAEKSALLTLKIDNKPALLTTNIGNQQIEGTNYYWTNIDLQEGKHLVKCDSGSFSGIVFGYGSADAYSYILGSSISNPFVSDTLPPKMDISEHCGLIKGKISETLNKNTSGLQMPLIITDSTYNYKWALDSTNNESYAGFTAEPIDYLKDGKFTVELRDKNGNGKKYTNYYSAIKITSENLIDFGDVSWNDSTCYFYKLFNYGSDTLLINSLQLNDPRLEIKATKFPFYIFPDDSAKIIICFKPNYNKDSLISKAKLSFDCGSYSFDLKASVYINSLITKGYDFGRIILGDSACEYIYITNQGSRAVNLTELYIPPGYSSFKIDTAGIFPRDLNPLDTLFIKVCFKPDSSKNYFLPTLFINSLSFKAEADLIGKGISPSINSVYIDFKSRRIGTTADTTFYFYNNGNVSSILDFDKTLIDNPDFDKSEITTFSSQIKEFDSIKVKTSFKPSDFNERVYEAEFKSDWKLHKAINLKLRGYGTMPDITTFDYDFGKLHLNLIKQENVLIIKSGGNEKLTIDEIKFSSGDDKDFIVDYSNLKNLILYPDSQLIIPITFSPTKIGKRELVLEVIHDANPNYKRSSGFIKITGFGVLIDLISDLTIDREFKVCNDNSGIFTLKNKGNIEFNLDTVNITASNCNFTVLSNIKLPAKLYPDSVFNAKMTFKNVTRDNIDLNIKTVINDTLIQYYQKKYTPILNTISIDNLNIFEFAPGDTTTIKISGEFNSKTEDYFNFKLKMKISQKLLFLLNKSLVLNYGAKGEKTVKCKVSQTLDEISVETVEKIISEKENIIWSIEFPFLVLLNEVKQSSINLIVAVNDCFEEAQNEVKTVLKDVCVFNVRNIRLIPELARFNIELKEKEGILVVNAELMADEEVNFNIFDINGKKILNNSKYYLHKGNQSVIFEISSFASGVYLFSIETSQYLNRKMIVLTK